MSRPDSIGHYRITDKLGEGGMGEVWRARDLRLNRDVAVKFLPESFANDSARMQRFEREAQLLASLDHPNIAAIYAVEQGAIVMEVVDGDDLCGPVPVSTVIDYARQIAAGLEAAHEKGIVHRDLKPANIKVTRDGIVKLLDFGLAKAEEALSASAAASPTISPTLSLSMTQAGMILGTAAYMSPEQARGKPVDKRADIWAFGVVLYEMLTGKPLYGGAETMADTLAAVVLKEPDYTALPADTPPRVRALIERCLRKDPKRRLRDIGDARLILDEPESAAPDTPLPSKSRPAVLPWIIAGIAVAGLALAGAALWFRPQSSADPPVAAFVLPMPEGTTESVRWGGAQSVPSPDGRYIAYVAAKEGKSHLWLRPLGSSAPIQLERTDGASMPFWSPDSQSVAFFTDDKLKKIAIAGGPPLELCTVPGEGAVVLGGGRSKGEGGTWNREGVIVFSPGGGPLLRVSADGGAPAPVTTLQSGGRNHSWPQFLSDGNHILYFEKGSTTEESGVYVQELGSSQRTRVMKSTTRAMWAPPGYLLYLRGTNLFAQKMDGAYQLSGEPVVVAQDVNASEASGWAAFAVSGNGVLVYRSGMEGARKQVAWRDRNGKTVQEIGKTDLYICMRRSPDEQSVLLGLGLLTGWEVASMDMATGVVSRVTDILRPSVNLGPWSKDARRIAVNTRNAQGIFEVSVASGQKRALGEGFYAEDWLPDGKSLLCRDNDGKKLALLETDHPGQFQTISEVPYRRRGFRLSPDGRSVAYESEESHGTQIVVAAFPSFGEKRQVSIGGGSTPAWRSDGKELFFLTPDWTLMAANIQTVNRITADIPAALFKLPLHPYGPYYEVSADGRRILVLDNPQSTPNAQMNVLVNWTSKLKRQ